MSNTLYKDKLLSNTPHDYRFPRCQELREKADLSTEEVAKLAGITPNRVKSLERSKAQRSDIVLKVIKAINAKLPESIDPSELLEHKNEVAPRERIYFPDCASARQAIGLSIEDLAVKAAVRPGIVNGLESGEAYPRYRTELVYAALQAANAQLEPLQQALTPQRFLPECRTLREKCKLTINELAQRAEVERELIKHLERKGGACKDEVERVFAVLKEEYFKAKAQLLSIIEMTYEPEGDDFITGPNERPSPQTETAPAVDITANVETEVKRTDAAAENAPGEVAAAQSEVEVAPAGSESVPAEVENSQLETENQSLVDTGSDDKKTPPTDAVSEQNPAPDSDRPVNTDPDQNPVPPGGNQF